MNKTPSELYRDNPFDLNRASDYSDVQVYQSWVDFSEGQLSLLDFIKPTSPVPMLLLGGKGSGKTHLMRYCSSSVQALRHSHLRTAIEQEKYLGIYTNGEGLNVSRFSGKGQSNEVWETIFPYSFELWLAGNLLASLRPALAENELGSPEWNATFIETASDLFHNKPSTTPQNYDDFENYINQLRVSVDIAVNNVAMTKQIHDVQVNFNHGDLIFGLPRILGSICPFLHKTSFVYLIDEVEIFTESQQKFLNSIIRYRKWNTTIRVGARLYGIKTFETLGAGEPIKRDTDFVQVELDAKLREDYNKYETLATNLVLKKLEAIRLPRTVDSKNLHLLFAELLPDDYFQGFTLDLVKQREDAGNERPHVVRFREAFSKAVSDTQLTEKVIENLKVASFPLLEKTNFLLFYKHLSKQSDPLELSRRIKSDCDATLNKGKASNFPYYETYSHFSSDLLAQLCRDYGRKPTYAGFKTLVKLSQGVPRNLLSLLRNIYRRAIFNGDSPFLTASISVEAQVLGIQDASEWFWEDSQPDEHGSLVRSVVENLATLMRSVRYSESPSECDLSCFLINLESLTPASLKSLKIAENWSFLIRVSNNSGAKNNNQILTKFQLNPMLSARWGISEVRRGAIELKQELADSLLGESDQGKAMEAINHRVSSMNLPQLLDCIRQDNSQQGALFNDL